MWKIRPVKRNRYLITLGVSQLLVLFYTEFLHHHLVISQCAWSSPSDGSVERVVLIADTHLLGSRLGHWADRLRREWQMHVSYMALVFWLRPDWTVFLGDLFDEGKWCGDEEFRDYVRRFDAIFPANGTYPKRLVVVGNHDIGFHYSVRPHLVSRFSTAYNTTGVSLVSLPSGTRLVLVNSVAMQADSCLMCHRAQQQLHAISEYLACGDDSKCTVSTAKPSNRSRPLLLQHYPLFRESDRDCGNSAHTAPSGVKHQKLRPGWDCLTRDSSGRLLQLLRPRLVVSGHTHHYCSTRHRWRSTPGSMIPADPGSTDASEHMSVTEYSVASFNWRNKRNPSFLMLEVNWSSQRVSLCAMAVETTVFVIYTVDVLVLLVVLAVVVSGRRAARSPKCHTL